MSDAAAIKISGLAIKYLGLTRLVTAVRSRRGVTINRADVLAHIISKGHKGFTSSDVATALGTKEQATRAAISWLKLAGFVEIIGWHETKAHVRVYRWTGKYPDIRTCRRDQGERALQQADEQAERMTEAADTLDSIFMRMVNG